MINFRDVVAQGIMDGWSDWNGEDDWASFAADGVVHHPDFDILRSVLFRLANGPGRKMDNGRRQLEIWGLPESVINWVTS